MSARDFDIAILGSGCAGLSLACALVERGLGGRRLIVVEPRQQFVRDRTWCNWQVESHPFDEAVAHSWRRWTVRHRGRSSSKRPWLARK